MKHTLNLILLVVGAALVAGAHTAPAPVGDIAALLADRQSASNYSDQLRESWREFHVRNLPAAIEQFQAVLDHSDAAPAERVQALFGIGMCRALANPPTEKNNADAHRCFQQIVAEHPDNPAAPWALIELAKLAGGRSDAGRQQRRDYYRRILDDYPHSTAIHEACLRLAQTYFVANDNAENDQAVTILENHLAAHPENPLASTMHFRLTYWYEQVKRDYQRGQVHAVKLGEMRMCDPYRWSMQYWNIGQTYYLRLNQPEKALPWYQKILDECPRARLRLSAREMVEQINAELGPDATPAEEVTP